MLRRKTTKMKGIVTRIPGPRMLRAAIPLAALALGACSPALDWRDVHPQNTAIQLTFPCKTQQLTQPVVLAGRTVPMSMTGCVASGMTFAVAHADMADPALVAPALAGLRQAALQNVGGTARDDHPAAVDHATPGLDAARDVLIEGHDPQGAELRERVVLFAQGTQVYQATVVGPAARFQPDAAATFTGSIRLPQRP